MWRKWGTTQNSFQHLPINLKNKYLLKKLLKWTNKKQNNFNIYNPAFLLKKFKINTWWHDLQFLRYRVWQPEIGNNRSFFALIPSQKPRKSKFWKNEKNCWRHSHSTQVYQNHNYIMYISWNTEWNSVFFVIWDHFYPFTLLTFHKIKTLKTWKKLLEISIYTCIP